MGGPFICACYFAPDWWVVAATINALACRLRIYICMSLTFDDCHSGEVAVNQALAKRHYPTRMADFEWNIIGNSDWLMTHFQSKQSLQSS